MFPTCPSKIEKSMRFEVDGPAFADAGYEIEIGDDVRRGDIVWFDRISPQKLVMRLVTGQVNGQVYQIDDGSDPDSIKLIALNGNGKINLRDALIAAVQATCNECC